MNKELILEISRMNQLMIHEAVAPPAAIKFVKNLFKEFPLEYKNLFKTFEKEEEDALKIIQKRGAKVAEVETAVEKLLLKVNWEKLADKLIANKKLGDIFDNYITKQTERVLNGQITKEQALKEIDTVINDWVKTQGINELGPALAKNVESKIETELGKTVNVFDKLSEEAQTMFNQINKNFRLPPGEVEKISQAAEQIQKKMVTMSASELAMVVDKLKQGGIELEETLRKLEASEQFMNELKRKGMEQKWNVLKIAVGRFNKACNLVYDSIKANKPLMGIISAVWKLIKWGFVLVMAFKLIMYGLGKIYNATVKKVTGFWDNLWDFNLFGGSDEENNKNDDTPPNGDEGALN
jgi:hypothetical protein